METFNRGDETVSTPTLAESIDQAIWSVLCGLFTGIPATIESYDPSTKKASAKPMIKKVYKDGEVISMPVVNDMPVVFPTSGKFVGLTFPVSVGDECYILFAQRSIDNWLSTGVESLPATTEKFSMNDGIVLVGLSSFKNAAAANGTDVELFYRNAKIRITPKGEILVDAGVGGKVAMGNATVEVLDMLGRIIGELSLACTTIGAATSPGPTSAKPLLDAQALRLTVLQQQLALITGKL